MNDYKVLIQLNYFFSSSDIYCTLMSPSS